MWLRPIPSRLANTENMHMKTFLNRICKFLVRDDGPTAVEYAVMLALIVVVCLSTITIIGTRANGVFNTVANRLPAGS